MFGIGVCGSSDFIRMNVLIIYFLIQVFSILVF